MDPKTRVLQMRIRRECAHGAVGDEVDLFVGKVFGARDRVDGERTHGDERQCNPAMKYLHDWKSPSVDLYGSAPPAGLHCAAAAWK
jgi:hypothetical protein